MYQALIPAAVGAGSSLAGGVVKMLGQDDAINTLKRAQEERARAIQQAGGRESQRILSTAMANPQRNPIAAQRQAAESGRRLMGDLASRQAQARTSMAEQIAGLEQQKGDIGGQLLGAAGSALAGGAASMLGSGMGQEQAQPTSFDPNALIAQKNAAMPQFTAADKSMQAGQGALQQAGGMPMMGLLGQMGQVPAQMPQQQPQAQPLAMGYGQQPIVGPSDQPIVGPSDNPFLQMFPFRMG